jgi:hypothetical protein
MARELRGLDSSLRTSDRHRARPLSEKVLSEEVVNSRRIYKGYTFTDVSTPTGEGRYRARVVIVALDGENIRSQRFLDLEIFQTEAEARDRTETAAISWIDGEGRPEQLSLPTYFAPS